MAINAISVSIRRLQERKPGAAILCLDLTSYVCMCADVCPGNEYDLNFLKLHDA